MAPTSGVCTSNVPLPPTRSSPVPVGSSSTAKSLPETCERKPMYQLPGVTRRMAITLNSPLKAISGMFHPVSSARARTTRAAGRMFRLSRRDRLAQIGRVRLLIKACRELFAVQFAFPGGDDDRRNAVAADIGQRPALAHELVDAKHDRHARHQSRTHGGERTRKRDEACAGNAGGTFGRKHG